METYSLTQKLNGFFWLIRPLNSFTAGLAVIVALYLALSPQDQPFSFLTYLFVASAAFFVTAHAMVHNDIVDYEVDKINAPHRALPSGKITMYQAKVWAIILFFLALGSGLIIDLRLNLSFPFSLFWAFLNIIILDSYNLYLKKSGLFGNLIIGYVVSALFLYADIVVNSGLTLRTESIGLYAFFLIWGREVFKGIRDIEGDREHGINTIPVLLGKKGGAIVGSIIIFAGVGLSIPLIIYPISSLAVPIVLFSLDIIIIYWCIRIIIDPTAERAQHTKLWLLRFLLLALIILATDQIYQIYIIQ